MELADIRGSSPLQGREHDEAKPRLPGGARGLGARAAEAFGNSTSRTRGCSARKPFFIDKMPNNFRHIGLIT